MYSSVAAKTSNRKNPYLRNDIIESSQEKLLLKVYDYALSNCKQKNIEKTNKAINELIFGLRFDEEKLENISAGLFRLYNFCKDQMRKRNYDLTYKILSELRESWVEAFKQQGKL